MTLLEKIRAAREKADLDRLEYEIILDRPHFKENQAAFMQRHKELNSHEG